MKYAYLIFFVLFGNNILFSMEKECNDMLTPKNQVWRVDREIQCEPLQSIWLCKNGPGHIGSALEIGPICYEQKDRLSAIFFSKNGREIIAWNNNLPLCFVWDRYNGQLLERIESASASNPVFEEPRWQGRLFEPHSIPDYPEGLWSDNWKDYDMEDESEIQLLAIYNPEHKVCTWDKIKNQETFQLQHNDRVYTACFNQKGTEIMTTSKDCTMRLWSAETGEELFKFLYDSGATAASFNEKETEIVVATDDGTIQILVLEEAK